MGTFETSSRAACKGELAKVASLTASWGGQVRTHSLGLARVEGRRVGHHGASRAMQATRQDCKPTHATVRVEYWSSSQLGVSSVGNSKGSTINGISLTSANFNSSVYREKSKRPYYSNNSNKQPLNIEINNYKMPKNQPCVVLNLQYRTWIS